MDKNLMFLCHTRVQKIAVGRMLESRGCEVYPGTYDGNLDCPVMAYDERGQWVGYTYPCSTIDGFVEDGRKLIDLKEHLARGGY